ncbi:uncharacterized protein BO88DRAFT_479822 [Aspergillus vadensis CBS 113365]|uniref:NAD(P)-binding protein n=1 Tax=Aspergillus vadensis (strain CBS 113365 / IMI 142717 / IBT 24658) TaxID=1448311 RepID=A0A319BIB6_ASPVC|nr:hypothetical protein BO88DRAFT_479822 [Aspergillus vadensis CBS 113365]PYH70630.1 hypothetical protein BO88DRAFT_479822 [Aspergillus vadensis CBS 113365]
MVDTFHVDVYNYASVSGFAQAAASQGPIEAGIHTAGLSPSAGSAQKILEVDLLGTANAIDAFFEYGWSHGIRLAIGARADHHGPARTYGLSERGNILRVQAAAKLNSIGPGINGPAGKCIARSPVGRVGTPQDVVSAVAFLASSKSSLVTGNDILVDGGVVSSSKWDSS